MVARLRPGVIVAQAGQEMDGLKTPFYEEFPSYTKWTSKAKLLHEFRVWPLQTVLVSDVRQSLLVLFGAVLAVLLVACLNLAGLMTARAAAWERGTCAVCTEFGATRSDGFFVCSSARARCWLWLVEGWGWRSRESRGLRCWRHRRWQFRCKRMKGYWGIVAFVMGVALLTTLVKVSRQWTVSRRTCTDRAGAGGQAAGASGRRRGWGRV